MEHRKCYNNSSKVAGIKPKTFPFLYCSIFSITLLLCLPVTHANAGTTLQVSPRSNLIPPPQHVSKSDGLIRDQKIRSKEGIELETLKASSGGVSLKKIQKAKRAVRRKQILTMFLLRIGFILLSPISIFTTVLCLAMTLVFLTLRILTLNLTNRDTFQIAYILFRSNFSFFLACVTGFINPIFAIFGLVASSLVTGVEIMEPILRIKYRRELKRLRHLHKLITDPVLMETMGMLMKSAQSINLTHASIHQSRPKVISSPFSSMKSKVVNQSMSREKSKELVDLFLQSSAVQNISQQIQSKGTHSRFSPRIQQWGKEQYQSLRRSGLLEEAANQAVEKLSKELESIMGFLPYLEAIEKVRKKKEEDLNKHEKARNKKK